MKPLRRVVGCLVTLVWLPILVVAQNTIAITEFLNESNGDEASSEWVELYNYGSSAVNLAGWSLVDEDTDVCTLPSVTIAPGSYVVVARNKTQFEIDWLAGVADSRVLSFSGTFAMSATSDELVLRNASSTVVWRIAYLDDDTAGRATWYTGATFTQTSWGTKASPGVNRRGTDVGRALGYESNDATGDPYDFSGGNRDWGSPLRGPYGAGPVPPAPHAIDVNADGLPINPGVRGVALSDITIERPIWIHGIPDSLLVSDGGSLRGVAGGLYADLYDWRTRVSSYHSGYGDATQPRAPTLEFLRWARDHEANLFITTNTRGLVEYDPVNVGKVRYYTSDTLTLAQLAADWVRYTNHITQTYRQGDTIGDARDAAIVNSLVWSSGYSGDSFDKLLAPGEAAVPRIVYWEIGNEPTVSVSGGIGVSNGYTMDAASYAARYKAIATAMRAEDPTIKVGPCLVNGTGGNAAYVTALVSDPAIPVDFIAYHPYQKLGDQPTIADMEEYLGTVYSNQRGRWQDIRDAIIAGGRNPDTIEMAATEVNVSDWDWNETIKEGEMGHALGSVETVFVFGRLGLTAGHYWIWPADAEDGTRYPLFKAYEKLRDFMGDCLIDFHTIDNRARIYTTRDSATGRIAVWALNFQNTKSETLMLSLTGVGGNSTVRKLTLKNPGGVTSLTSANIPADIPGGPRNEVDWVETNLLGADPADLELLLEPATITLLLVQPESPTGVRTDCWLAR